MLDVPNLSVDQLTLTVEQLHALVNLDARLLNLLQLSAGVDANLGRVNLDSVASAPKPIWWCG